MTFINTTPIIKACKFLGVFFCAFSLTVHCAYAKSENPINSDNTTTATKEEVQKTGESEKSNKEQSTVNEKDNNPELSETSENAEPGPVEVEENSTSTGIYIGIGALAAGAIALGLSGGSSSSDPEPVVVTEPPVGPDINGDWNGTLNLVNYGSQAVSATITHSGTDVTITTNSSLPYGKLFTGTISASGYILVWDADTGEDWTTHYSNASSSSIKIYDYVNNLTALDELVLYK